MTYKSILPRATFLLEIEIVAFRSFHDSAAIDSSAGIGMLDLLSKPRRANSLIG